MPHLSRNYRVSVSHVKIWRDSIPGRERQGIILEMGTSLSNKVSSRGIEKRAEVVGDEKGSVASQGQIKFEWSELNL